MIGSVRTFVDYECDSAVYEQVYTALTTLSVLLANKLDLIRLMALPRLNENCFHYVEACESIGINLFFLPRLSDRQDKDNTKANQLNNACHCHVVNILEERLNGGTVVEHMACVSIVTLQNDTHIYLAEDDE